MKVSRSATARDVTGAWEQLPDTALVEVARRVQLHRADGLASIRRVCRAWRAAVYSSTSHFETRRLVPFAPGIFPHLKVLFLDFSRGQDFPDLAGTSIRAIASLRQLAIFGIAGERCTALQPLAERRDFTVFHISFHGAPPMQALISLAPLTDLIIWGGGAISDQNYLRPLSSLQQLKSLEAHGIGSVSSATLSALRGLSLRDLRIPGSGLQLTHVDQLAGMTTLQILDLSEHYIWTQHRDWGGALRPLQALTQLTQLILASKYEFQDQPQVPVAVFSAWRNSVTLSRLAIKAQEASWGFLQTLISFSQLRVLALHISSRENSQTLGLLGSLKRLRELKVFGGQFSSAALRQWSQLRDLTKLKLRYSAKVCEEGARQLQTLTALRSLGIVECSEVPRNSLVPLSGLVHLLRLNCRCTLVTNRDVSEWRSLTQLTKLKLADCPKLSARALESIASLSRLHSLNLARCYGIEPRGFCLLSRLEQLTNLNLLGETDSQTRLDEGVLTDEREHMNITDEDVASWTTLKRLHRLAITSNQISQRTISALTQLSELQRLNLDHCNGRELPAMAFQPLGALTGLAELSLQNTWVSDDDLAAWTDLTNLRELYLGGCPNITLRVEASLRSLPALGAIVHRYEPQGSGG